MVIEILETLDGTYLILWNGYQWGPDPEQFDYAQGCSTQTFPTEAEAVAALGSSPELLEALERIKVESLCPHARKIASSAIKRI
jgi:hypothetical protein